METVFQTAAKVATKEILSPVYGVMKYTVKHAGNRGAADNDMISRLDRLTESQEFEQNTVRCLARTPKFTAPITKLVKRRVKIAVIKKASFYVPSINAGK